MNAVRFLLCRSAAVIFLLSIVIGPGVAQQYDLLLKNGHIIDPRNHLSAERDVAIRDGRIAAVAEHIDSSKALKTVDAQGLYVTPGLVDIHVHVYYSTGEAHSYAGDNGVQPDGFTFRVGVTSVADAGSSGYRNFEDFKKHVIDRSKTRVLAFINIVGAGMRGPKYEDNLNDMDPVPAAEMAKRYPDVIVGIKTAHFAGPEWTPVEHAVQAGNMAHIPVMIDFGANKPERPISVLFAEKLRPGDIYTHVFSGLRNERLPSGKLNPALEAGRKRGIIFDLGHGGGSFSWPVAEEAMKEHFLPDSISTDLHIASMNNAMKDMLNVMDKFLALGVPLDEVIAESTWHPAREIQHEELGNLSVGSPADVAVLRLEKGKFGFTDMYGARMDGNQKLICEMTVKNGKIVYDLNGISRPDWKTLPKGYKAIGDPRWDGLNAGKLEH